MKDAGQFVGNCREHLRRAGPTGHKGRHPPQCGLLLGKYTQLVAASRCRSLRLT
jgi:hypothetical protein